MAYVERDPYAATTLLAGMETGWLDEAPVLVDDLARLDASGCAGRLGGILAGYPCQPFSAAGKRRGADDPRHLWPGIHRIVAQSLPGFVFLENVRDHLTLGFDEVSGSLLALGYRLAAGLVSAQECGAPHRRDRLFILGVLDHSGSTAGEWDAGSVPPSQTGVGGTRELNGGLHIRPEYANPELADPIGERPQGQREDRPAPRATVRSGGVQVHSFFVPRPNDTDAWRELLADQPHLAPSVEPDFRRGPYGVARRSHRLRVLGNGCVPVAVAYAFCALWASLSLNEDQPV